MIHVHDRRNLRVLLMAGAAFAGLLGTSAFAQDGDGSVDSIKAEIERLRAQIEALSKKVEEQEDAIEAQKNEIAEERRDIEVMREEIAIARTATPDESASQAPVSERPIGFNVGGTEFTMAGFIKLDFIASRYSDGAPPSGSLGRDFHIPSLTPVGEGENPETVLDFNPRETRLILNTTTPIGGKKLISHLEFDFQVTNDGDERVSNTFPFRIRQGYFDYGAWRFGMAWSTFQDVRALPEALDFIGPAEGTVFNRQPMIRYTARNVGPGKLEFAIEQPESTITNLTGGRTTPGADIAPDVVARYSLEGDWGHVSLAGIGRILRAGDDDLFPGSQSDEAFGGGASLSGKIKIGARDDFRFMATAGTGLGRYIGVNLINGANVDPDGTGELETIPSYSGFLAYRHFWSSRWRSNIMGGVFVADHPESSGLIGDPTDNSVSSHVNLLYSPVPNVTFGLEHIFARRGTVSDAVGTLHRFQFSAKYGF